MTSTCQKCEKEKECFEYRAFYGKVNRSGNRVEYSDIRSRTMFLCNTCARAQARTRNKILIACIMSIGLIPLCILSAAGNQNTAKDFIVPSLIAIIFAIPCYFLYRNLKKLPSQQEGELEIANSLGYEFASQGYTAWTETDYKSHVSRYVSGQVMDDKTQSMPNENKIITSLPEITNEIDLESAVQQLKSIYNLNPEGFRKDSTEPMAERIRQIGRAMNQQGGMEKMLQAHLRFTQVCDVYGAKRNIEFLWDGIGQWQG